MKIYQYHESTGELLGEGIADADPLEPGRWLIPAYATTEEPMTPGEGQFVAWNGSAWELRDIPTPPTEPVQQPSAQPDPAAQATTDTSSAPQEPAA